MPSPSPKVATQLMFSPPTASVSGSVLSTIIDDGLQIAVIGTATLRLKLDTGISRPIRTLCDPGSQLNLITLKCANKIGLPRSPTNVNINGVNGASGMRTSGMATASICSRFNDEHIATIQLIIVPKLPQLLPNEPLIAVENETAYADPEWHIPGPVQILISAGTWGKILCSAPTALPNGLIKQSTKLGDVIFGEQITNSEEAYFCGMITEDDPLSIAIQRLWEMENRETRSLSEKEQWCQDNFSYTHTRTDTGRYVVTIPLNPINKGLGESRRLALRRFYMMESRFAKNPELAEKYVAFMHEYEALGHMRPVDNSTGHGDMHYYIPHHAVLKKFRVVFNGSAPTSNGESLNSIQLSGPKLQPDLTTILTNFRVGAVAFCADIAKMYRQIAISPSQWNLQRIFWRETPNDPLREYWLTVVTYGLTSSAYNAVRALIQCAIDHNDEHPVGARIVHHAFYMDDMLACADTISEAIHAKQDVVSLLEKGGFQLDKWVSNSPQLMPEKQCLGEKLINIFDTEESQSVLGLKWDYNSDSLALNVRLRPQASTMTKRDLASEIARVFDPLHVTLAALMKAKQFLKETWELKIGWDMPIPGELHIRWMEYYADLENLRGLKIPRWFGTRQGSPVQVHIFSDASEEAYGAAAYIVTKIDDKIYSHLAVSNNKLAPKKVISIPRMELCGALMSVQLCEQLSATNLLKNATVYFWTDSEILLHWLRKSSDQLKVFVANRIAKIQRRTTIQQWNHVKSAENPADLLTRGISVSEMLASKLWWHGPDFISECFYVDVPWRPTHTTAKPIIDAVEAEVRPKSSTAVCNAITYRTATGIEKELVASTSSLRFAVRVMAYVLRVARKWLCSIRKNVVVVPSAHSPLSFAHLDCTGKHLSATEREQALMMLVQHSQKESFADDYEILRKGNSLKRDSRLIKVTPFLDEKGIMRVRGRLSNMNSVYDTKHPMILDGKSALGKLIIADAHLTLCHGTPAMIQVYIRTRFHMVRARVAIRNHVRSCVPCVRYTGSVPTQQMGDLPAVRVNPAKAFHSTGVDYAGPFSIKRGRGQSQLKVYIAIFVCMVYKAVHLEIVMDLTTDAFLAALDRAILAKAGQIRHIYSDNGRNFVGAERELLEACESWSNDELLKAHLARASITWHFNPPINPHAGGLWERGVQSVKSHLKRMGAATTYTHEELSTLLARISMCLNSRPLSAMSDDPQDLTVLTPGHFLVGGPMVQPWAPDYTEIPNCRLKAWQQLHKIQQEFWNRWREEVILEQNSRNKWLVPRRNLAVGDMVMLRNHMTPPTTWLMGRVIAVFPGKDDLVRIVEVRTEHSVFKRPIGQLCLLPVNASLENEELHESNSDAIDQHCDT